MLPSDPRYWMFADALELLQSAERLRRQFFQVGSSAGAASWEPPVDIYETAEGMRILVALPGVAAERLSVAIEDASIVVAGDRPLPVEFGKAMIHRLEIPYGRFERRIALPQGRFELLGYQLDRGCLVLGLLRVA